MEQYQRQQVINAFREGEIKILVATDVAARGLNVVDISHVFNYHIPYEAESYVHRIGRTGRAGRKGFALSLLTPKELRGLQQVIKMFGTSMEQGFVPTLDMVQKNQSLKLVEKIISQSVHHEAKEILKSLQEKMDLNQIGLNLLSMLVEKQKVEGPQNIGVARGEIEHSLSPSRNEEGKGRYRGRKPSFSRGKPYRKEFANSRPKASKR